MVYGVEVSQLLETAKACGSNPAGSYFKWSSLFFFSEYRPSDLFCRLTSRSPIFFEGSVSFEVAVKFLGCVVSSFEETTQPRSSIPVEV